MEKLYGRTPRRPSSLHGPNMTHSSQPGAWARCSQGAMERPWKLTDMLHRGWCCRSTEMPRDALETALNRASTSLLFFFYGRQNSKQPQSSVAKVDCRSGSGNALFSFALKGSWSLWSSSANWVMFSECRRRHRQRSDTPVSCALCRGVKKINSCEFSLTFLKVTQMLSVFYIWEQEDKILSVNTL